MRYYYPLTTNWFPGHDPALSMIHPRYQFGIRELSDGTYTTAGYYGHPTGQDCYGRPCIFPTRAAAIRTAAARTIRDLRNYGSSPIPGIGMFGGPQAAAIRWVRQIVATETGQTLRRPDLYGRPRCLTPWVAPNPLAGLPLAIAAESACVARKKDRKIGRNGPRYGGACLV